MKIRNILLGLALLASGSANASTVFAPTDGNINFIADTFNVGTELAMFDDSDVFYNSGTFLTITPLPENVAITSGGTAPGDFTAENEALTKLNLTGSNLFRLGISTDNGITWVGDISTSPAGTDLLNVTFSDGTVLSVDIKVVPIPPAVWLFGSGLLGLVGIARRRKTA
jgi:hypothetical protein